MSSSALWIASTVTAAGSYSTVIVRAFASPSTVFTPSTWLTAMRIVITQPSQVMPGTFSRILSITSSLRLNESTTQVLSEDQSDEDPGIQTLVNKGTADKHDHQPEAQQHRLHPTARVRLPRRSSHTAVPC